MESCVSAALSSTSLTHIPRTMRLLSSARDAFAIPDAKMCSNEAINLD